MTFKNNGAIKLTFENNTICFTTIQKKTHTRMRNSKEYNKCNVWQSEMLNDYYQNSDVHNISGSRRRNLSIFKDIYYNFIASPVMLKVNHINFITSPVSFYILCNR